MLHSRHCHRLCSPPCKNPEPALIDVICLFRVCRESTQQLTQQYTNNQYSIHINCNSILYLCNNRCSEIFTVQFIVHKGWRLHGGWTYDKKKLIVIFWPNFKPSLHQIQTVFLLPYFVKIFKKISTTHASCRYPVVIPPVNFHISISFSEIAHPIHTWQDYIQSNRC